MFARVPQQRRSEEARVLPSPGNAKSVRSRHQAKALQGESRTGDQARAAKRTGTDEPADQAGNHERPAKHVNPAATTTPHQPTAGQFDLPRKLNRDSQLPPAGRINAVRVLVQIDAFQRSPTHFNGAGRTALPNARRCLRHTIPAKGFEQQPNATVGQRCQRNLSFDVQKAGQRFPRTHGRGSFCARRGQAKRRCVVKLVKCRNAVASNIKQSNGTTLIKDINLK